MGVEPICTVLTEHGLKIAPSTYYAARTRPPSTVAQRHALLLPEVAQVQTSKELGRGLYGARKVWKQLLREDVNIGRGQVETLMRIAGLRGIRRVTAVDSWRPSHGAIWRPRFNRQPSWRRSCALDRALRADIWSAYRGRRLSKWAAELSPDPPSSVGCVGAA